MRSGGWLLSAVMAIGMGTAAGGQVVISQVWGGGGTLATAPNADFVELVNRGSTQASLDGWSVQVAGPSGSVWRVVPLTGVLEAGEYLLVRVEAPGSIGTALSENVAFAGSGASPLLSTAGKAAIVNTTTALSGTGCPIPSSVQDFVGYGSADCFEGASPGMGGSSASPGWSIVRACGGLVDSGNSLADFSRSSPVTARSRASARASNLRASVALSPIGVAPGATLRIDVSASDCPAGLSNVELISVEADLASLGLGVVPLIPSAGGMNAWTVGVNVAGTVTPGVYPARVTVTRAGGAQSATSDVSIRVTGPGDSCGSAIPLGLGAGGSLQTTTTGRMTPDSSFGCAALGPSVWFEFTAPSAGVYQFDTEGSLIADTVLAVFDACEGALLACDDDSGSGALSILALQLAGGQTVRGVAGGWAYGASGEVRVTVLSVGGGACCGPSGACVLSSAGACQGQYGGDGSVCALACPTGACCDAGAFTCTLTTQSGCAGGAFQGFGTACLPGVCPGRGNDECAGAVTLDTGLTIFGNTGAATGANTGNGSASCGVVANDVWFRWVAPGTGTVRITTMNAGGDRAALFDGGTGGGPGCTALAEIGCVSGAGWIEASVQAGRAYFARVGQRGAAGVGALTRAGIVLSFAESNVGACCVGGGGASVCSIVGSDACASSGGTITLGGVCRAAGAGAVSASSAGATMIPDYRDLPGNASASSGLTISSAALVADVEVTFRSAHTFIGDLVIELGKDGRRATLTARPGRNAVSELGSGARFGSGAAYVFTDAGGATLHDATGAGGGAVAAGSYRAAGTGGQAVSLRNVFNGAPAGGTWTLSVSDWTAGDVGSFEWSLRVVEAGGGGGACDPVGGVCCVGARCAVVASPAACAGGGGTAGATLLTGSMCNTTGDLTAPCCFADYNKLGGLTIQDVFDFLTDWFAGSPNARVGGDGATLPTVQDVFDHLASWFAGGC